MNKKDEDLINGLIENCARWREIVHGLIKAGDRMAEMCKNKQHRQAWWDAKSHFGYERKACGR